MEVEIERRIGIGREEGGRNREKDRGREIGGRVK